MKKLPFLALFLFVGIPAFALLAPMIPKSDYVWIGVLLIGFWFWVWVYAANHFGLSPEHKKWLDKQHANKEERARIARKRAEQERQRRWYNEQERAAGRNSQPW